MLQAPPHKTLPQSPALLAVPRSSRRGPRSTTSVRPAPLAASQQPSPAAVQTATRESSNILPSPMRRQELEEQTRRLLEEDSRWHEGEMPPNMVVAISPKHFKQIVTSAAAGQLVVVDYFAPHCCGCRTLYPKLKQISTNNEDCIFINVNTDSSEMRELAINLGVEKLPWFQFWRDCDIVASFTANISTVSVLRAEIATHKACTDPGCAL